MQIITNNQQPFIQKLGDLWSYLVGENDSFSFQSRIFHSVTLILAIATFVYIPFNFFLIDLFFNSTISFATFLTISFIYYKSRFKNELTRSVFIGCLLGNVFLIAYFFTDSGIHGVTELFCPTVLVMFVCCVPYEQKYIWTFILVTVMLLLHIAEYFYPDVVPYNYKSRTIYFLDETLSFFTSVIIAYFSVIYLRRNYHYERTRVREQTDAIEHQYEGILLKKTHLEQLNGEKSKLMSIISHDLRAPLSNIKSYLEMVSDFGLTDDDRAAAEGQLLKITESTLSMLSKLLIWSKAQMHGVSVNLKVINLLAVLKNTVEMEIIIANKKDITLSYDIKPDINVLADSDMLELVIRNLISNAIKFTPSNGKIAISAEATQGECKIAIKDTGTGIPYAKQDAIFSLTAESTYGTQNEKGVGLGLLLCKEFMESQRGSIGFESVPGEGSSFFISVPLAG